MPRCLNTADALTSLIIPYVSLQLISVFEQPCSGYSADQNFVVRFSIPESTGPACMLSFQTIRVHALISGKKRPGPAVDCVESSLFCSIVGFSAAGLYHHAPGMRTIPGRQLDDYDTIFAVCREKHPERFYQPVRRMHTEPTPEFAGSLSLIPGEKQYLPQRPEMH